MDSPVVLSRTVAPICLPAQSADPDQFIDQNAMILGWDKGNGIEEYIDYDTFDSYNVNLL